MTSFRNVDPRQQWLICDKLLSYRYSTNIKDKFLFLNKWELTTIYLCIWFCSAQSKIWECSNWITQDLTLHFLYETRNYVILFKVARKYEESIICRPLTGHNLFEDFINLKA